MKKTTRFAFLLLTGLLALTMLNPALAQRDSRNQDSLPSYESEKPREEKGGKSYDDKTDDPKELEGYEDDKVRDEKKTDLKTYDNDKKPKESDLRSYDKEKPTGEEDDDLEKDNDSPPKP